MFTEERNQWLQMSDEELLKICRCDVYISTGKGGQKRNKTASAVRLTHIPTGITGNSSESRQQTLNKHNALRSLRINLGLELRAPAETWEGQMDMNVKNPQYSLFIGVLLDNLVEAKFQVSTVAEQYGVSTGKMIKILAKDDMLWQAVNKERQRLQLKPLKKGR